jgi:hypothetical protein
LITGRYERCVHQYRSGDAAADDADVGFVNHIGCRAIGPPGYRAVGPSGGQSSRAGIQRLLAGRGDANGAIRVAADACVVADIVAALLRK